MTPEQATAGSPLVPGRGLLPLPKYFAAAAPPRQTAAAVIASLGAEGYWLAPLGYNSHPYKGDGSRTIAPGSTRWSCRRSAWRWRPAPTQ